MQPVSAHVVWFDYKDGEYNILFGHPEEGAETYETSRFKEAIAYDINKQTIPFSLNEKSEGLYLTASNKLAAIQGFFDNGYFARLADDTFLRITEEQISNYENVGRYLKYTKAFYDWSDALAQPFNLPLEIQPLNNPLKVIPGGSLLVNILSNGNPISENVTVEYLGQIVEKNADGTYSIPIGKQGLIQPIEASYSFVDANNLRISYETSLTAQNIPEPSALLGLSVVGLFSFYRKKLKK
ncbi:DUF4198 domain-containing protein [Nostoc sp. CENA543]|uniref:DUF4198 domain-containing protein n=1 Tax=Nostoc sp. CENA543 TaxID=1869241 RepID=UPI001CEF751A|nr:DUF4198 domain-containing protein [Nostoc sp. CENA543]